VVIKKISNSELTKLIEDIILEQQDKAIIKGLLAAEIKLALSQKYDVEVHSNRISRLIKNDISGVKTTPLQTTGIPINIYRIMR